MADPVAPTSAYLFAVRWLARAEAHRAIPLGSGVVVHHLDDEYLATALHVAQRCNFQPLIRQDSQWRSAEWETMGKNARADIAVLKTSTARLSSLTPRYGAANVLLGAVGRAMGFPSIPNPNETGHIEEVQGIPVPLTTLVSAYLRPGGRSGIHYAGGYVNAGFSGGAMLLPTGEGWTIAGIITHRGTVSRNIFRMNPETGEYKEDKELAYSEPSGLVRFADFGVVIDLIESGLRD